MRRRAARVDRNQPEIVEALRKVGCRVAPMHAAGQGFPDLVVGIPARAAPFRAPRIALFEVKDGQKPLSERRLTPEQEAWHALWSGYPIYVVESVEQALEAVK